jgi:ADP-ribose pyrophosphatase YjhB (NUDIX family)
MTELKKVIAYITKNDKLLVFLHPNSPEAGLQVPAGTVNEDESLERAVMREVQEETGLDEIRISSFLGQSKFPQSRGYPDVTRFFFHLICNQETPSRWRHEEKDPSVRNKGDEYPIIFELYWIPLSKSKVELPGYYSEFLYKIL